MAGVEDNLAPVAAELTVEVPLWVEGAVPPVLEGLFVRNGPNAAGDGASFASGDGMVHAVALRQGQAVAYRNRWVRTRALAARTGGQAPRGPAAPVDDTASTHVVWHAGALLALGRAGLPHVMTADLETLHVEDFGGALPSPVGGHPHRVPRTGALVWVSATTGDPPLVQAFEIDPGGSLAATAQVAVDRPGIQQDFGLTERRLVVFDDPGTVDPTGDQSWRVGVLERGAGDQAGAGVRWSEVVTTGTVSHVANAYDDNGEDDGNGEGGGVVLDVCRSIDAATGGEAATGHGAGGDGAGGDGAGGDGGGDPSAGRAGTCRPAVLERWRVGPAGVTTTQLDDRPVGLPRVDGTLAGLPHRYVYCVQGALFGSLVRYDMHRDEAVVWDPGPDRAAGEPVFVRDPDGHADDEGWILSFVYDARRGASDLVIIDGSSWGGRPDAVVHLAARVPYGLHGSWVPAALYR